MTINADCNNNKLEVSVTSNGLELMSSPVNGVVNSSSSTSPPDDNTSDQFVSLSSTSSTPLPDYNLNTNNNNNNTNHIPETHKLKEIDQNAGNNNRKATVKVAPSDTAKHLKAEVVKKSVQRHQSCPLGAAKMSPARPLTNGIVASAALPTIDNCDIYDNSTTSPVSPRPPTSRVLAPPNGVFPTVLNPIPPPRKPDALTPNHKTAATAIGTGSTRVSQPPHPRQQQQQPRQPPIDWKAKLNHELTLYQKLLQSQSRPAPPSPTKTVKQPSSQQKPSEQRPITPTKQ
jgi:hypothetical protein